MILARKIAKRLIAEGKAREAGLTKSEHEGEWMVIVDRLDLQRVDHYHAEPSDIDRNRVVA